MGEATKQRSNYPEGRKEGNLLPSPLLRRRGGRQIYIPSMINISSVQVEIELTALLNIVFWGLSWHRILGRAVCQETILIGHRYHKMFSQEHSESSRRFKCLDDGKIIFVRYIRACRVFMYTVLVCMI